MRVAGVLLVWQKCCGNGRRDGEMPAYELGYTAAEKACATSEGEVTIKHDLDPFTAAEAVQWVDGVFDSVAASGRNVKGMRVETGTFRALGIVRDSSNSGPYRGSPVVETMLAALGTPVEVVVAAI